MSLAPVAVFLVLLLASLAAGAPPAVTVVGTVFCQKCFGSSLLPLAGARMKLECDADRLVSTTDRYGVFKLGINSDYYAEHGTSKCLVSLDKSPDEQCNVPLVSNARVGQAVPGTSVNELILSVAPFILRPAQLSACIIPPIPPAIVPRPVPGNAPPLMSLPFPGLPAFRPPIEKSPVNSLAPPPAQEVVIPPDSPPYAPEPLPKPRPKAPPPAASPSRHQPPPPNRAPSPSHSPSPPRRSVPPPPKSSSAAPPTPSPPRHSVRPPPPKSSSAPPPQPARGPSSPPRHSVRSPPHRSSPQPPRSSPPPRGSSPPRHSVRSPPPKSSSTPPRGSPPPPKTGSSSPPRAASPRHSPPPPQSGVSSPAHRAPSPSPRMSPAHSCREPPKSK